jgi:hypothetical protein
MDVDIRSRTDLRMSEKLLDPLQISSKIVEQTGSRMAKNVKPMCSVTALDARRVHGAIQDLAPKPIWIKGLAIGPAEYEVRWSGKRG